MSVVNGREVPTPELDRFLKAIEARKVNDVLSEFLDWLVEEKHYEIVRSVGAVYTHKISCPSDPCYFGVDRSLMTPREMQVWKEGGARAMPEHKERWPCEVCGATGYIDQDRIDERSRVTFPRPAAIIAEFLGLDEDKMEEERRALLEALRTHDQMCETGTPF